MLLLNSMLLEYMPILDLLRLRYSRSLIQIGGFDATWMSWLRAYPSRHSPVPLSRTLLATVNDDSTSIQSGIDLIRPNIDGRSMARFLI